MGASEETWSQGEMCSKESESMCIKFAYGQEGSHWRWRHVPFFFITSQSHLVAQLTPLGLHCSPVMRVTSAPRTGFPVLRVVPAALWFSWLLMWRLRSTKGQSQFAAGRVWGRSCFGLISITGLKFGEMLCRSAMIKGFQKESQFPKSHNFSYDVKLMRISSTTWERCPRRAWAEFVSTYGTSYVWLKTSNETRILTLYPLLEATRSRKVSWLQTIGHKRRNKFI